MNSNISPILIAIVGSILFLFVCIISLATAVTRSEWWTRKRRISQRYRSESHQRSGRAADRLFHYTDIVLEALAFQSDEDDKEFMKLKSKCDVEAFGNTSQRHIPLRFQPERLYGATSTLHRDNLRKKSWTPSQIRAPSVDTRRSSMIDSLWFLSPKAENGRRGSSVLLSLKHEYPQREPPSKTEYDWKSIRIPQIDVTCVSDVSDDGGRQKNEKDYENTRTSSISPNLAVSSRHRRASSSNLELGRRENTIDDVSSYLSEVDEYTSEQRNVGNEGLKMGDFLRTEYTWAKRGSLKEPLASCVERIQNTDESKSPNDKFADKGLAFKSLATEDNRTMTLYGMKSEETDGGYLALIFEQENASSNVATKMSVELRAGRALKSLTPWLMSSYNIRFTLKTNDKLPQHASINCKAAEFGSLHFRDFPHLLFDVNGSRPAASGLMQIDLFENSNNKWSGTKEHFHGSITISQDQYQFNKIIWHPVKLAYPNIRIKADILVSLCLRQLEGIISVGVHELRNIQFESTGSIAIENMGQLVDICNLELDAHACLTCEGHLIKSKKIKIHRDHTSTGRKVGKDSKYTQFLGDDHLLQFSTSMSQKSPRSQPLLAGYGVIIFMSAKHQCTNETLPKECLDKLRRVNIFEVKSLFSHGECFIGHQNAQADYRRENGTFTKLNTHSAALWNEATGGGMNRVYQWLSVE